MLGLKLFSLIVTVLFSGVSTENIENVGYYSETMAVTEVDYATDTVVVTCFNGNEFMFEGCEDWLEGDLCSALMCDNGTECVYDDIICDVKYAGWTETWGWDFEYEEPMIIFNFEQKGG